MCNISVQVAAEPQMAGLLSGFIYSSEGASQWPQSLQCILCLELWHAWSLPLHVACRLRDIQQAPTCDCASHRQHKHSAAVHACMNA